MAASSTISRITENPDELDFASLRKHALDLVQNLSGKIWTDYNLHDPGVTIIEQLCFGLTELAYQSDISVAEYLSDEHGVIDYNQQALYKPHDIFPNSAVTLKDYCKLLIDSVSEIDAIHMERADTEQDGVFNINIKLLESLTGPLLTTEQRESRRNKVKGQVRYQYLKNRNLSEDVDGVYIEETKPCFLKGVIETTGFRPVAEIIADVFFQCSRKISSDIHMDRYEDIYAENADLSEIFTGPLTQHGYIHEQDLSISKGIKPIQEINGVIAAIDGVNKIYDLALVDGLGNLLEDTVTYEHSFYLQFPQEEQLNFLRINFNAGTSSEALAITGFNSEKTKKILSDTKRYLQRLEFEYNAFRTNKKNAASFYYVPEGVKRPVLDYYSIQHHFPNNYGINAEGLPSSESDERRAQAKQLKSYLFPSEQLMANFLQQLQDVKHLFALNETRPQSYFSQYLGNSNIPHIEDCYVDSSIVTKLNLIQRNYDNYADRRSRALDTLLAIYGESFPDEALSHFNDYYPGNSDHWMIENKINYLRHLKNLGGERSKGFNQALPQWHTDNISNLQKKVSILLGFNGSSYSRSLTQAVHDLNITLVDDKRIAERSSSRDGHATELEHVPELKDAQIAALGKWQYTPDKNLMLSLGMLRDGVYLNNYRLSTSGGETRVYFHQTREARFALLKSCKQKNDAVNYVHKFKKIIASVCLASEGFHLLEHILLRPRMFEKSKQPPILNDFFDFKVSIIFPAWTARFSNPAFRQFAQRTLAEQLPAHLFPTVYWLDFSDMEAFEKIYQDWLEALHQYQKKLMDGDDSDPGVLNSSAQLLTDWLQSHAPATEYWV